MEEPPAKKLCPAFTNREHLAMIRKAKDYVYILFGILRDGRVLDMKKRKWQEVVEAVNEVSKVKRSRREVWLEFGRLRKEVHEKNVLIRREERKRNTAVETGRKYDSSRMLKLNEVEKKFNALMDFAVDEGMGCYFDRAGLPTQTSLHYNSLWRFLNEEQTPTDGDLAIPSASCTKPTAGTTTTTTTTSSTTPPAVTPKEEIIETIPTASTLSHHTTAPTAAAYILEENADFEEVSVVKEEIDLYESDPLDTTTIPITNLNTAGQSIQDTGQGEANVIQEVQDTHTTSTPQGDGNADSAPAGVSDSGGREMKEELKEVKEAMKEIKEELKGVREAMKEIKEELKEVRKIRKISRSLQDIRKLTRVVAVALTEMTAAGNGVKP